MPGAGMQITTRELPDHETLAAVFRSAKIEPWQMGVDAASLAACERDIHPDDRARFHDAVRGCLAGGECALQYRAIGTDGHARYFESHVRLIRDSAGAPLRIMGIRRDASGDHERLAESERDVVHYMTVAKIRTAQVEIEQLLLNRARRPEDVTMQVLETYCRHLGWTCAQLWTVDRDAGLLRQSAGWCDSSVDAAVFVDSGDWSALERGSDLPGRIWESRAPASIPDLRLDRSSGRAEKLVRLGLRSAFGFPLIVGGDVTAVVEMFSTRARTADQRAIEMNAAIGSDIGRFIERMNAEQELSDALHDLKHLQKVTDAALSHISLGELLGDLLPKICDAMSTDACVVFLADHGRQELYSLTGFARNGLAAPPQARLPFGESFAGRVAAERRLLTHRDVPSDPTVRPEARAFGAESAAGVPLLSGQRLVGVLVVASRAARLFNRDETNLLELVGQRLTTAIVNSSLYEDAREGNRVKDRFLAVASHELRGPITGILGWTSLLRTETDPAIRAEALDWIEQSARTQAQLVSDLLDVTRIREGKVELRRESIDVRDAVQTAIRVVETQARERGVIIEASMPAQPVTVSGDATRLQQVVWNLLGNAVKFTPPGKHVRASVEATGSAARITVADEGDGIKPEFLPHVFNAFEQDSNGKRAGGLGLGLHIVSTIVSMHGGTIEAMSDGPGRGATFAVTLPAGAAA